jgi:hypothetical protein
MCLPESIEADPGGASVADLRRLRGDSALDAGALNARAQRLLIGVSVYRKPADRNALLFQVGEHDWTAARADRPGAEPPYRAPAGLADLVAACRATGALTVGASASGADVPAVFVDPQIAADLHRILTAENRHREVAAAHLRAARYWQWRAGAWPGSRADVRDLIEARHHLLEAPEIAQACQLTEVLCAHLHAWGDLDSETELISEMMARLPDDAPSGAGLLHGLGRIAQVRREYTEAQRHYELALCRFADEGDGQGVARCHHDLGVLAQARGSYAEAERRYRLSAMAATATAPDTAGVPGTAPGSDSTPALDTAPALYIAPAPGGTLAPGATVAPNVTLAPGFVAAPGSAASAGPHPGPAARPGAASPVLISAPPPGRSAAGLSVAARKAAAHRRPSPRWWRPGLAVVAAALLVLIAAQLVGSRSGLARTSPATRTGRPSAQQAAARQTAGREAAGREAAGREAAGREAAGREAAGREAAADSVRRQAAAWIARQVSRSAIVACDPAMCSAVAADLEARRQAGSQLLRNSEISLTAAARRELAAGDVDPRLLITLVTLAALRGVRVLSFGGNAAGASAGMPLCSAELADPAGLPGAAGEPASAGAKRADATPARAASASYFQSVLSFLRAQRAPFLAAAMRRIRLPDGQAALIVAFASPSPLGLLDGGLPSS